MKISEAAKKLGISVHTIRNLEKKGVISVRRAWNRYRDFDESEIFEIQGKLFPGRKCEHISAER